MAIFTIHFGLLCVCVLCIHAKQKPILSNNTWIDRDWKLFNSHVNHFKKFSSLLLLPVVFVRLPKVICILHEVKSHNEKALSIFHRRSFKHTYTSRVMHQTALCFNVLLHDSRPIYIYVYIFTHPLCNIPNATFNVRLHCHFEARIYRHTRFLYLGAFRLWCTGVCVCVLFLLHIL